MTEDFTLAGSTTPGERQYLMVLWYQSEVTNTVYLWDGGSQIEFDCIHVCLLLLLIHSYDDNKGC